MTPRPTIEPIGPAQSAVAALAGLLGVGLLGWWWQGQGGSLPIPGPVAWASLLLVAGGIAWLATLTRRAVREDRTSLDASQALTRVLLGRTSLLAGAFAAGAYGALVLLALPALPAPLAVERVVHGAIAVVAALGWAVAGAFLQSSCRIPPGDEDDAPGSGGADEPDRP